MAKQQLTRFVSLLAAVIAGGALAGRAAAQESPVVTEPPPPPSQSTEAPEALPACPPTQPPPAGMAPTPSMGQPPAPGPTAERRHHNIVFAPTEIGFATGAGVTDYFGGGTGLTARTDPGAAWDARFVFGTHSILALEAGYLGAVNTIDVAGGKEGHVNSNGLDGDLRIQLPTRVQPYIFAGLGWNHMSIDNGNANPSITGVLHESDEQLTVPAGGGVSAYIGHHATVDLRGTYRLVTNNDISVMNDRSLHQWVAQARLGYAF